MTGATRTGKWAGRAAIACLALASVLGAPIVAAPVAASESKGDEAPQPFITLAPLYFSVLNKGRVIGVVTLELVLEVKDPAHDSHMVQERVRQLEGDFAAAGMEMARQVFRVDRPIDPDLVSAYLTPYAERRLGPGKVDVLVKQALIRPS